MNLKIFIKGRKHPNGEEVEIEYPDSNSLAVRSVSLSLTVQEVNEANSDIHGIKILDAPGENKIICPLDLMCTILNPDQSCSIIPAFIYGVETPLGTPGVDDNSTTLNSVGCYYRFTPDAFGNIDSVNAPFSIWFFSGPADEESGPYLFTLHYTIVDVPVD